MARTKSDLTLAMSQKVQAHVWMPFGLKLKTERLAAKRKCSMADIVREALEAYLKKAK